MYVCLQVLSKFLVVAGILHVKCPFPCMSLYVSCEKCKIVFPGVVSMYMHILYKHVSLCLGLLVWVEKGC